MASSRIGTVVGARVNAAPFSRVLWFVSFIVFAAIAPSASFAAVHVHGPTKLVAADQDASIGADLSFANLQAARGEVESFQIVVDGPASNVSASLGPINGPAALAQDRVRLYRAVNYQVVTPSDNELGLLNPCITGCSLPNVLVPERDIFYNEDRNAFPDPDPVAAGRNVTLWVDVSIPAGQLPGLYTSTVTVSGQGVNAVVPWSVSVKPVTIPATSRLRGSFSADFHSLENAYGGVEANVPGGAWDFWSRIVRLGLDNRISTNLPSWRAPNTPGNAANFSIYAKPYFDGTGTTEFPGAHIQDVLPNRYEAENMGSWYTAASSGGWLDRLTWYCDEVGYNNDWSAVCSNTEYASALASWRSSPGAPAFMPTTIAGTPYDLQTGKDRGALAADSVVRLVGLVTRMDVKPGWQDYPGQEHLGPGNQRPYWNPFLAAPNHSAWLYTDCIPDGCDPPYEDGEPNHQFQGWPSYAIDQAEGEARAMAWQVYAYDLTGEYYYETLHGFADLANTNPHQYYAGANGDGTLFYLGRHAAVADPNAGVNIGGVHDIPLESWRLKQIRDGREDYELIRLLEDQQGRQVALAHVLALMPNLYSSNVTAAQYAQARAGLFAVLHTDDTASYLLTVASAGAGAGSVSSTPPGISCGSDCTESYTSGTIVTLTALADAGSEFTGWSGGCTGTTVTCQVTMTAARSVTATFALTPAGGACTLYAAPAADGGSDANPGTKAQPKESPIVLLGALAPGQTGCLKDGALFELGPGAGQTAAAGALGQPLTLRPETPGARATIRASSGFAFFFASHDIVLKDLNFRRPSLGTPGSLFQLNGDRITLDGVDLSYPDNTCLDIGGDAAGGDADPTEDVVVRGSLIHDCGSAYGSPRTPNDSGAHGIDAQFTRRLLIENSLIYSNHNRGIRLYPDADDTIIRRNLLHANGANLNIGSEDPGFYSENNLIENNVLTDSVLSGLQPGGFVEDTSEVVGYVHLPPPGPGPNAVYRNCISNAAHPDRLHEGYGVLYGDNIENQNCTGKGPAQPAFGTPRRLYTIAPCRALDTRDAPETNPFAGPLSAGGERHIPFRGRCGVPLSAVAVSANLTVTSATAAGNLRAYPAGTVLPGSSTINYGPGQTRANTAIVGLNSSGYLTVRADQASGSVHFVLDVNGYFQ